MDFPILSLLIFMPLVGVALMQVVSGSAKTSCRMVALWFSLMTFGLSLALPALYDGKAGGLQLWDRAPWIPTLGVEYSVAMDGISLWLIMLTTLTVPIVILASWRSIDTGVKGFHVSLLALETAIIGAFVAQNLILFYLFWEAMLVPMALMIGIWGGGRRIYSAFKFFLFTAAGSLPMLLAMIYMWWHIGQGSGNPLCGFGGEPVYTFDLATWRDLLDTNRTLIASGARIDGSLVIPLVGPVQLGWCFAAFALAFAVKIPVFPIHTWLPDAHSDAPTGGSVILAGVLLKMGIYGFIRFAFPLFPQQTLDWAWVFQTLAVVGILYGAFMAMVQTDMKRLVAYSSISHLGFCVLGLFALTQLAVVGSVFQMLAHGVSTGALFLLVGVIYDRRHTREISEYGGLASVMPTYARIFLVVTLASIGLPLTVGFVGEFLILAGSFKWAMDLLNTENGALATIGVILATTGVILGAIYMLRLYQRLFWGEVTNDKNRELSDLSTRESVTLWPFLVLIFVMGIYPAPFLSQIDSSVVQLLKPLTDLAGW